jgi:hypothetical protein
VYRQLFAPRLTDIEVKENCSNKNHVKRAAKELSSFGGHFFTRSFGAG